MNYNIYYLDTNLVHHDQVLHSVVRLVHILHPRLDQQTVVQISVIERSVVIPGKILRNAMISIISICSLP